MVDTGQAVHAHARSSIAMPKPMAEALGYPGKPHRLGRHPRAWPPTQQGWAAFGHPEWGPFRLGKTNPNFSTSGLSALIAQDYAATGKTADLTAEDLDNPTYRGVRRRRRVRRRPLRRHHR